MSFRMSSNHPSEVRGQSKRKEPKKLYFFFVEGEKTETLYFSQLAKYEACNPDIDIRLMDRWTVNKGHSNQYKMVKVLRKIAMIVFSFSKNLRMAIETLRNYHQKFNH